MSAKLRLRDNVLWVSSYHSNFALPIHLLYANVEFGRAGGRNDTKRLLRCLQFHRWDERRVLSFLAKHQQEFRDCLEWLANGSEVNLSDILPGDSDLQELYPAWKRRREVKFLQLHGLEHGGAALFPVSREGASFSGIELRQKDARDPLDPICWHLVELLMVFGTVGVRKCKYAGCQTFFAVQNTRKVYCKDACRANDFMSQKTPEERARLMKDWRANPRHGQIRKQTPGTRPSEAG